MSHLTSENRIVRLLMINEYLKAYDDIGQNLVSTK